MPKLLKNVEAILTLKQSYPVLKGAPPLYNHLDSRIQYPCILEPS